VYQISLKSEDFSLRYGNITIFKITTVRHLGFLKFAVFYVAFVAMRLCFLTQSFAEIGQSVDELRPKEAIFKMVVAAILNFKTFGHVTAIGFNICCSVLNFIEIG